GYTAPARTRTVSALPARRRSVGATSCTLAGDKCSVTFTAGTTNGTATITANYLGSTRHAASTGSASVQINALHSTATTLSCTPTAVALNQPTSCAVTVKDTSGTPTTPTGTVNLKSSGTGTLSV